MLPQSLAFLLFFLSVTYTKVASQTTGQDLSSVDQLLESWQGNNPGLAIGIVQHGKLIYAKGWGVANQATNMPINSQTAFHIASMSKQFIAAAIGLLNIRGKLDLNASIVTYLPELNPCYQAVTIRHLIHQTSGVKDYADLLFLQGNSTDDFIPIATGIVLLNRLNTLNFEAGTAFGYSNSNYLLLSEIVSRVSQIDFRAYIQREFLTPLGMTNTYFINYKTTKPTNLAIDYTRNKEGVYEPFRENYRAAADQIISTIQDLTIWDQNLRLGQIGGAPLRTLLLQPGVLKNGEVTSYAFGLFSKIYRGLPTISHAGDMGGYHCQFLQFPKEALSIIILSNASDFNAYRTSYQIADLLLKDRFLQLERTSQFEEQSTIQLSNKQLKKYLGAYWDSSVNRPRIVYFRDDTLRYNRPDIFESPIVPIGNNQFNVLGTGKRPTPIIEFIMEEQTPKNLIFKITDGTARSMEKYTYPDYSRKELSRYTGNYYCSTLNIRYEIRQQKSGLTVWINEKEVSRLVALNAHYFKDGYLGDFHFITEPEMTIKGFYLNRLRTKRIYFEKTETD